MAQTLVDTGVKLDSVRGAFRAVPLPDGSTLHSRPKNAMALGTQMPLSGTSDVAGATGLMQQFMQPPPQLAGLGVQETGHRAGDRPSGIDFSVRKSAAQSVDTLREPIASSLAPPKRFAPCPRTIAVHFLGFAAPVAP